MPEPRHTLAQFNNWVHAATRGHDPATQQRVRECAFAAYQEHLAHGLAQGLASPQARDAAIRALGDPRRINNDPDLINPFRRSPTVSESFRPLMDFLMRRKPQPARTLEVWLQIATHNLNADDKARVRSEIETHYQDARTTLLEAGSPAGEAEREALAGLGSPLVAARMFAKSYLTLSEQLYLEELRDAQRRPLWIGIAKLVAVFLAFATGTILQSLGSNHVHLSSLGSLLYLVSFLIIFGCAGNWVIAITSHYILDFQSRNATRRLKVALLALWSLILILVNAGLVGSSLLREDPASFIELSLMTLFTSGVIILFARVAFQSTMALRKKIQNLVQPSNQRGPDQYA